MSSAASRFFPIWPAAVAAAFLLVIIAMAVSIAAT